MTTSSSTTTRAVRAIRQIQKDCQYASQFRAHPRLRQRSNDVDFAKSGSRVSQSRAVPPIRQYSTTVDQPQFDHPAITRLKDELSALQPTFGVRGDEIDVLTDPKDFHQRLLHMIKTAKKRIIISALYIGTEQAELVEALREALINNPHLRVTIIVDFLRSTREQYPKPSTATLFLPLVADFSDRVEAWFYRSPKLKGLMEKIVPRRFDEGWGLWHCKWYGADDEVILSGANLSTSYFTDRQDRYYHIRNQPTMLSYFHSLLRLYSSYSYRLLPSPPPSVSPHHLIPVKAITSSTSTTNLDRAALVWPEPSIHPRYFSHHAMATITAFQRSWRDLKRGRRVDVDTWIWPMAQAGVLGIGEEERGVLKLLECADAMAGTGGQDAADGSKGALVDFTSGYFGLYNKYKDNVLKSKAPYRIVAASPEANGFFGSAGVSGLIPEGYTLLESQFHSALVKAGREWEEKPVNGAKGIELREWKREGWTYHAKGIWLSSCAGQGAAPKPFATFIGSSNLSTRSLKLDLELSTVILTKSTALRNRMAAEVKNIRTNTERVGKETWDLPSRHVSLGARLLMFLGVEGML